LADERKYAAYVVPGGKLWHHAAIFTVHFGLRIQRMAQQALVAIVEGHAGFIAGSFNAKNKQSMWGARKSAFF
jgi:hypothetical protein